MRHFRSPALPEALRVADRHATLARQRSQHLQALKPMQGRHELHDRCTAGDLASSNTPDPLTATVGAIPSGEISMEGEWKESPTGAYAKERVTRIELA